MCAGRKTARREEQNGTCHVGPLNIFWAKREWEILMLACWHVVVTRIGLNLCAVMHLNISQ